MSRPFAPAVNHGSTIDMVGKVCGSLTVLRRAPRQPLTRQAFWVCRCECDEELVVSGWELRNRKVTSCARCDPRGARVGPR